MNKLIKKILKGKKFLGSIDYWEDRYHSGGNSGEGSYNQLAEFKAQILNQFVNGKNIKSVIEFGCGDGNQLSFANYPSYIGLDVSVKAIELCYTRFINDKTKSFFIYNPKAFIDNIELFNSELALSLDVIYHIVEDDIFYIYMKNLFDKATTYVIIYSTNINLNNSKAKHIRHRKITEYIRKNFPKWELIDHIPNKYPHLSKADFFIYKKLVNNY